MKDASHVLTGVSSGSAWGLTNCATDALVLTGGGLGGCRWVCAKAGAAGEVRLTYSDRSISNWGTQEPTNQTRAQHSQNPALQRLQDEEVTSTGENSRSSSYVANGHRHDDAWRLKYGWENMETGTSPTVYTLQLIHQD